MSATNDLIAAVQTLGGSFSVVNGRLRIMAPHGSLPSTLLDRLRTCRDDLIAQLSATDVPGSAYMASADAALTPPDPTAIWWRDTVLPESTPIRVIPPPTCIGPIACGRLGPCQRRLSGLPCESEKVKSEAGKNPAA